MKRLLAACVLLVCGRALAGDDSLQPFVNSVGMKLVPIAAGEFEMGSAGREFGRWAHEHQHHVAITRPYFIGAFEVTQQQFEAVMGANPSAFHSGGAEADKVAELDTSSFPVDSVTWQEAVDFCTKLSEHEAEKQAGRIYRLPTEAEWEYACRAGTDTPFHYGESLAASQANFDGNWPYLAYDDVIAGADPAKSELRGAPLGRTTTVGSYEPNAWGLYDAHGNVREWCADWYSPTYYKSSPAEDPTGPEEGTERVARGGGWYYFGAGQRSAQRYHAPPEERRNNYGFRVVCEIDAMTPAAADAGDSPAEP